MAAPEALIHDVDGDTTVSAVRTGGELAITVDGSIGVRAVTFAKVEGAGSPSGC